MSVKYGGEIKARIIEVRFALSGKISRVNKLTGDRVGKWDVIASLDRKILQTELDRQLADYEKVRADFEVYAQKNAEPQNDLEKYLKAEKQASLNASVKEVELAKAKLDQADLLSPVDGIIIDDGGITAGLYITPSNSPLNIADTTSYYFEFEIEQKDISDFSKAKKCKIEIEGIKKSIESETTPVFSTGKKFIVKIKFSDIEGLMLGMKGSVSI